MHGCTDAWMAWSHACMLTPPPRSHPPTHLLPLPHAMPPPPSTASPLPPPPGPSLQCWNNGEVIMRLVDHGRLLEVLLAVLQQLTNLAVRHLAPAVAGQVHGWWGHGEGGGQVMGADSGGLLVADAADALP